MQNGQRLILRGHSGIFFLIVFARFVLEFFRIRISFLKFFFCVSAHGQIAIALFSDFSDGQNF